MSTKKESTPTFTQESSLYIPYKLERTPITVPIRAQEIAQGTNCQLYVAGVIRALGYFIPDFYRSSEIYENNCYTRNIDPLTEPIQTGDIIGFWKNGETNSKKIHLGIMRYNQTTDTIDVLHASKKEGQVAATPLEDMLKQPVYERIACVKRGTFRMENLYNPQELRILGFWDIRRSYPCEKE